MNDFTMICVFAAVIFVVSAMAAWLPFLVKKESESRLHLLIGFSTGIMIGVLFVMLLPEAIERTYDAGYSSSEIAYMILLGFVLLLVVDVIIKRRSSGKGEEAVHDITSLSAFVGLAIHSIFDGLALAAAFIAGEDVGMLVLIALCLHKSVVAFSLTSTMLMSKRKDKTKFYLLTFCLISPLASVLSYALLDSADFKFAGLALCFSVGIFAFVTLCDMLPESFHHRKGDIRQLAVLLFGLAIAVAVACLSGYLLGDIDI